MAIGKKECLHLATSLATLKRVDIASLRLFNT